MTPLSRRLGAALVFLALLCATGGAALILTSDHDETRFVTLALAVPIGLAFVGSGLVAWARRPENRTGRLMVLTGLTWYLATLSEANNAAVFTLGAAFGAIVYVPFVALVLAFPSGRLQTRLDRLLVGATLALTLTGPGAYLLVADLDECKDCPDNVLQVADVDAAAAAIQLVVSMVAAVITVTVAVTLLRRWRRATPALRRALTPVLLTAALTAALFSIALAAQPFSDTVAGAFDVAALVVLLAVPLAFLFGLLRRRLARAGAARMLLDTPDEPSLEEAEDGIRRALRDPTLQLLFWSKRTGGYVDAHGRPTELPETSEHRTTTKIEYEGRPLAALVHDATLLDEPELLQDVIATARVALEKDRTLRTLRATEMHSRALLDAIPDNMFRLTREGAYLDANIKDERYLPVPASELDGTSVHDVLPPETAELILSAISRALDTGEPQAVEYRMERPIGLRDSEARIVAAGDEEVVVIVRDITERKRQEAIIERERDFIRTTVNSAPSFFVLLSLDGAVLRFNDTLEATSGHRDDERNRGRVFWDLFVAPEQADEWRETFEAAAAGGPRLDLESTLVTASGERRFVEWKSTPIVDEHGEPRQLVTGADVTERHRHAAELEQERNFLNAIANNAASLLCLIDEHGRVADRATNVAFERLLEYETHETGGHVFWERYVHADEAEDVQRRVERVVAGEPPGEHDNRWLTKSGRSCLIAWSCTPLPPMDERRLFLLSGVDISARKRQELELEGQRDFLSALADASPSLLVVIGPDGRVGPGAINLRVRRLTGYSGDELEGRPFWEIFPPPEEAERVQALIEEAIEMGDPHEYETHWVTKSGERRLVAWTCTKMPEVDRPLGVLAEEPRSPAGIAVSYLVAGSDVTERARQRDALRRERDFLGMIANATPSFMGIVDADGRITDEGVNQSFRESVGYGDDELRGRLFVDLVVVPDDRAEAARAFAAVVAGSPPAQHESRWETRTGERLRVEWTAIPLAGARENQFLIAAVDVTERKRQEEELRRSRARIVEAADTERRRLERNLHDGAQQRLVSLSLSLRRAQAKLGSDPEAAKHILDEASHELAVALEELRELARGIHPAVLTDRGLGPALESLMHRAPIQVDLLSLPADRLPGPVEAAAFYVVSEALTNVAKYAQASAAVVRIERQDGYALVEVADDGVGGADPAQGSGLRGLADRVEALDGRLNVDSAPGRGTVVRAEIPVEKAP